MDLDTVIHRLDLHIRTFEVTTKPELRTALNIALIIVIAFNQTVKELPK